MISLIVGILSLAVIVYGISSYCEINKKRKEYEILEAEKRKEKEALTPDRVVDLYFSHLYAEGQLKEFEKCILYKEKDGINQLVITAQWTVNFISVGKTYREFVNTYAENERQKLLMLELARPFPMVSKDYSWKRGTDFSEMTKRVEAISFFNTARLINKLEAKEKEHRLKTMFETPTR